MVQSTCPQVSLDKMVLTTGLIRDKIGDGF